MESHFHYEVLNGGILCVEHIANAMLATRYSRR